MSHLDLFSCYLGPVQIEYWHLPHSPCSLGPRATSGEARYN
jgi:hypothetical protein